MIFDSTVQSGFDLTLYFSKSEDFRMHKAMSGNYEDDTEITEVRQMLAFFCNLGDLNSFFR